MPDEFLDAFESGEVYPMPGASKPPRVAESRATLHGKAEAAAVKVLLDTCTFLWVLSGAPQLSSRAPRTCSVTPTTRSI